MPIALQCPCGAKLRAPDAAAGKSLKCPQCSASVAVPDEQTTSDAPLKAAGVKDAPASDTSRQSEQHRERRERDDDRPRRKRDRGAADGPRRGVPLVVWLVGGGVALGGVGVVAVALAIYFALPKLKPREERQGDAPAEAAQRKAVVDAPGLGAVWDDFTIDAAAAAKKHGDRPRVRFTIDTIQKTSTGFMATRTLTTNDGDRETARFYFDPREGQKLAGRTGETIVVRGRVTAASQHLFTMFDCKLE